MDPQLTSLLLAVGIGVVAWIVLRTVFKIIGMGMNLLLLIVIVAIAYLLLRGG